MDGKYVVQKTNLKYPNIDTNLLNEKRIDYIFNIIIIFSPLLLIYFIFDSCIDKTKLSLANTITLGSIFATFGSAIISAVILIENNKLNRILTNIDILYTEILRCEKWTRWPFLKRYDAKVLLDGKIKSSVLDNPSIQFNLGSHSIEITIPTVQEDFYDLPVFYNFNQMRKFDKQFKTYIVNNDNCILNTIFDNIGDYLSTWDCLYDTWRNILIFKMNKLLLKLGVSIVITSFIYSFGFIQIYNIITSIFK